ncbi:MAG: hypothetical protein IT539_12955 [Bradyrhizobiaceae bacterium]|nr:hypothetical protein [Bradyrhizobiaceae bacterium]
MRIALIALAAAAAFSFAAPASAAPIAPAHIAVKNAGSQVEQVRHVRRDVRRHVRRDVRRDFRRHFWAPGPWAFRGLSYHNCIRVSRGGFVCYY